MTVFLQWKGIWRCLVLATLCWSVEVRGATGLLMPMYGNTGFQFSQVYEAAGKVPVIAILNPDDGVGYSKNSWIAGQVNWLKSRGVTVVGYINSQHGWRDAAEVDDETDKYKLWYKVNGIFVDEVSGASTTLNYYKSIRAYARLIGIGFTVLNPGTGISGNFLQAGDVIVDYENPDWRNNFASSGVAGWVPGNTSRAAGIIYGVPEWKAGRILDAAAAKGYGWVYVTDKNEPAPFGISASYFNGVVEYLRWRNHPEEGPAVFKVMSSRLIPVAGANPMAIAAPGGMELRVGTIPGHSYEVQCSGTMAPGTWRAAGGQQDPSVTLHGVVWATEQTWTAALPAGSPQCFFRVADVTP